MNIVKAHAYGNDFLLMPEQDVAPNTDRPALARTLCDRHRGIGADGLITYADGPRGARMQLLNADGSYSEVSGNGVRCLAAWLARTRSMRRRLCGWNGFVPMTRTPGRSDFSRCRTGLTP